MSTESASSPVEWASRPARHSATNIVALMTRTRIRTRRCRASTTWTSQHSSMGSPTSMRHGVTGRMASARCRSGLRQVVTTHCKGSGWALTTLSADAMLALVRITAVEPILVDVPLRAPLHGLHGIAAGWRTVLVLVATHGGRDGWGHAAHARH